MKTFLIWCLVTLLILAVGAFFVVRMALYDDPFEPVFADHCASCHGSDMTGSERGPALVGQDFQIGQGVVALQSSIENHPDVDGLPAEVRQLEDADLRGLAILIGETQTDRKYRTFEIDEPLQIAAGEVTSQLHRFRIEVFAEGLHRFPFSIAPLPDGGLLVTEKQKGLRMVSADGQVSDYIEGTPRGFDDGFELILPWDHGYLLDVMLHPDYRDNGWVYLHYTDRCEDCGPAGVTTSRNTVIRGRIADGRWMDQELIWQPDEAFYSVVPDIGAGGRLAFDDDDHLFISVGIKGTNNFDHVQDLGTPAGKIHRVNTDGSIPIDNPFREVAGAMPSVWTYGHRSPQGLEYNTRTGELWETEMGPRGGDEVNLLVAGKNYGWPLTSNGINYDGSHVEYGKFLDIEFDPADIEQPAIDLTPGPAVSSFAFYEGDRFPNWQGHAFVGSLAARELYRMNLRTKAVEKVLTNIGRIRDVEVGPDGLIYLLLEHPTGGVVARMVPAEETAEEDVIAAALN